MNDGFILNEVAYTRYPQDLEPGFCILMEFTKNISKIVALIYAHFFEIELISQLFQDISHKSSYPLWA